ncbi:DUF2169 family type VI secretion system accessory protein [Massilia antarctica]|uniref:DUF2169 family type VI secretion system accessory protein n=1 Tax=Massilia antarctica TaxID=2765360 RepID=UPI0035E7CC2E
MEFRNQTSFPSLAFEGIDQLDQKFHVVVIRQTLTWSENCELIYADEQAPLCEVDEYFGKINESSVRQESDLCQYKPKCDVIVNATAYAPMGEPPTKLLVRLVLKRPNDEAPLPEQPYGLNQFSAPTEKQMEQWRRDVQYARGIRIGERTLIEKTLRVTGERALVRYAWPIHTLATIFRLLTLDLVPIPTWHLTRAKAFKSFPLRYEYAYGGECRVNRNETLAKRIKKKYRIPGLENVNTVDNNESEATQAIAHDVFECNAAGRGYAQQWYLNATNTYRLSAPQVELVDQPFSVADFASIPKQDKSKKDIKIFPAQAGFGIRSKVHPLRRNLAGTIDQKFVESNAWLPRDFKFDVWNAAPLDQQTPFLVGDEIIELTNLCAPESSGVVTNNAGQIFLRLNLPGNYFTLLMRMKDGSLSFNRMYIDTLIVEPEEKTVSLVWRAVFEKSSKLRAVDAFLHGKFEFSYTQNILNKQKE